MDSKLNPRLQQALIEVISEGLPLVKRPYAEIATRLNCSEAEVIDGIREITERGDLKRFGVVVRHRKLGYRANGMVVWDVPDGRVAELGHCIGQYSFVTLCYQRPRRLPEWRYNLFSMIHGQDREAVIDQVADIIKQCGLRGIEHEILFSKRCFKQRGANYLRNANTGLPRPGLAVNE
ncbi:MAG: Lrp/AsnC family transcriptional regulator [Gammaproteobacteria bacterium]|nr:Lrp/AsnC family transcriptional regulator [Gammaproteobacteria bacterium]